MKIVENGVTLAACDSKTHKRLVLLFFWIMIPWGNFWANKWPILMGLGLIMTQICAYKVSFSSLISISRQLSLCSRDSFHFCMKQRLFPRVRPNDPFTFNTSVALTTTNTKEAKAAYWQKDNWSSDNWSFDNWTRDNWASRQLVFWTTGLIDNWTYRQLVF